ncbi:MULTISPECIES: hypothetical protein [Streptomyces]
MPRNDAVDIAVRGREVGREVVGAQADLQGTPPSEQAGQPAGGFYFG